MTKAPPGSDPHPPQRNPWDKLPAESFTAYRAFGLYRDLGADRTLRKVAGILAELQHRNEASVYTRCAHWSTKHNWVNRAAAWTVHLDRLAQKAQEDQIRELAYQQSGLGALLESLAWKRAAGHVDKDDPTQSVTALDPSSLTAQEVARLAEVGTRIRRTALGQPTEVRAGVMQITVGHFNAAIGVVADLAIRRLPVGEHAAFLQDVAQALGAGELGDQAALPPVIDAA